MDQDIPVFPISGGQVVILIFMCLAIGAMIGRSWMGD
jgi:hypothetical protein